jgi:hypothetical protein
MPADYMFWHFTNGEVVTYLGKDHAPVPLTAFRCKAELYRMVDDAHRTEHRCKLVIDHAGEHSCICGKGFENSMEVCPF